LVLGFQVVLQVAVGSFALSELAREGCILESELGFEVQQVGFCTPRVNL